MTSNREWPAAFNLAPKWAVEAEDVFDTEIQRIFRGPMWHLVGHTAEILRPGDFKTIHLGRTPLILVHQPDGTVRALHNACAHRGTMVEPRFRGTTDRFECPYHRWLYGLDGGLNRCPGEADFPPDFERANHGLTCARVETLKGLIFVTLSDASPTLATWLGDVASSLTAAVGGDGELRLLGYQKVVFDANWKVYIDDEGYHAPLLHKAFQILQWKGGSGSQVRHANGHRVTSTVSDQPSFNATILADPSLLHYRGGDSPKNKGAKQGAGSLLVTPWPLGAVMNHLDIINIRIANPLSPTQTEVHYAYFSHADDDPAMRNHRLRQSSNLIGPSGFVSLEDGAVFARIQKGLHAGPPETRYLRGWSDDASYDPYDVSQNDETTNTVWWEKYRGVMGFERAGAVQG